MIVTVSFGSTNSLKKEFANGTTTAAILADPTVAAALGYTKGGVKATLKMQELADGVVPPDGAELVLVSKSCDKATA